MASLDKEFEAYLQLKPPLPPGFLERLLIHLGDEIVRDDGESTIRLFFLPSNIQISLLEWLHEYSHLLPRQPALALFGRVDQFLQIDKSPPLRMAFGAHVILDQIRSSLGDTQTFNRATDRLVQAWMTSQVGQIRVQQAFDATQNNAAFSQFSALLGGLRSASHPAQSESDAMDLDFDIAIDIDDNVVYMNQKQSQEDLMDIDQTLSQPFAFASQGGEITSKAMDTVMELPQDAADSSEKLRITLSQIESANQLSTQVDIDDSTFSFLLTISESLLPLVYDACRFSLFSEAVLIKFIDVCLIDSAKDLSFSRSTALMRTFLLPFFKNMKSQASRNVMAFSIKLLKAHPESYVEGCLVPLAVESAAYEFHNHHADFIVKVLNDPSVTTEQLQRFSTLFLDRSANSALVWKEPLFDMISRIFVHSKMKFLPSIVQIFSIEIAKQTREASWDGKRVIPKIVTAINEIVKKSADSLASLHRSVTGNLRDTLIRCDTAAANTVLKKIDAAVPPQ